MTAQFLLIVLSILLTTPQGPIYEGPSSLKPVNPQVRSPESYVNTSISAMTNGLEGQVNLFHHIKPYPISLGISYVSTAMRYKVGEDFDRSETLFHNHLAIRTAYQGQQWRAGIGLHSHIILNIPHTECYEDAEESSGNSPPLSLCPDSPNTDPRKFHFLSFFASFGSEGGSMLSLEVTSELAISLFVQYNFGHYYPYFKLDLLFNHPFNNLSGHREQLFHGELGIKFRLGDKKDSNWLLYAGFLSKGGSSSSVCKPWTNGNFNKMESSGGGITVGIHYEY